MSKKIELLKSAKIKMNLDRHQKLVLIKYDLNCGRVYDISEATLDPT